MAAPVPSAASCWSILFPACRVELLTPDPVLLQPGDSVTMRARVVENSSSGRPVPNAKLTVRMDPQLNFDAPLRDTVQTDARGEVSYRVRIPTRIRHERFTFSFQPPFSFMEAPGVPLVIAPSPSVAFRVGEGAVSDTVEVVGDESRSFSLAGIDRFGNTQVFQGTVSAESAATASATCSNNFNRYSPFCTLRVSTSDAAPKRVTLSEGSATRQLVIRRVPRWTREVLGSDGASLVGTDQRTVVATEAQTGRIRAVAIDGAQVTRTNWLSTPTFAMSVSARRGVVVAAWDTSRTGTGPIDVWRAPYGGTFERVPSPPAGVTRQALAVDDSGRVIGGLPDGQVLAWNGSAWANILPAAPTSWITPPFGARVVGTLWPTTAGVWRIGTLLDASASMATPRVAFAANGQWVGVETNVSTLLSVSTVARAGDDLVATRRQLSPVGLSVIPTGFDATAVRYSGLGSQAALPEFPRGPTGVLPEDAVAHTTMDGIPVVQLRGPGISLDVRRFVGGQWVRIAGWEANSAVPVGSSTAWDVRANAVWTDASTFVVVSPAGLVRYRIP